MLATEAIAFTARAIVCTPLDRILQGKCCFRLVSSEGEEIPGTGGSGYTLHYALCSACALKSGQI